MMKNYGQSVKINHDPNWPYIPEHPYRTLIIGGSGSGITNVLLNLIKIQRRDIDKYYLYLKDPSKSKYQLFINGREKAGFKHLENRKAFIDYSQKIDDVCENYCNPTMKTRKFTVFDDKIADMESEKKVLKPLNCS